MKSILIGGILALALCMEAEASLNSPSEVRAARHDFAQGRLVQVADVSIGLGIHGRIGDHGYFNLYFSEPYYRYSRPYYHHRPYYYHRPYYGRPYYRYYPWPHRNYYRPAPHHHHPRGYPPGLRHTPPGHYKHGGDYRYDHQRRGGYSREQWFRHD